MNSHTVAAGLLASCLAASCLDSTPTSLVPEAGPSFLIPDAAHDGTVTGFYFLPPLVRNPSTAGSFDATRWPRVEICALIATEDPPNEGTPKESSTEDPVDTQARGLSAMLAGLRRAGLRSKSPCHAAQPT